jgi:hypothetical protein
MRCLLPLLVLLVCAGCAPIIVERHGPPPEAYPPPPIVYKPVPSPAYPPDGGAHRRDRDDDAYQGRRADLIIDRAYHDLLERAPDPAGREHYRQLIQQGFTEEQVHAHIRESVEYRVTLPDAKTARAYREILGREPDPSGRESYRKKLVDKGWTENDVKNDLRRSVEFRSRSVEEIVRRVYREVLGRDPDPDSLARYARSMREQGWTETQLRAQLKPDSGKRNRRP